MGLESKDLDYSQPRSDRGENDIWNRILTCSPCIRSKDIGLTTKG